MKAIVLAVVFAASCTPGQRVSALATTAIVLTACDVRQTLAVSNDGRWDRAAPDGLLYEESNPLLGDNPSASTLAVALAGTEVFYAVLAMSDIPDWVKYAVLGAGVALEAFTVARLTPVVGACGGRR